ncbi:MAG: hypothetical protein FWG48_00615 [Oscillospiraceae bacterium]|nr:hypothetical protein [Oscillospiraceae bacterium]
MAKFDVTDSKALSAAAAKYLADFPGDTICAVQLWYEGLGGQGVPTPEEMAAMDTALGAATGWKDIGGTRFEKYGVQHSFKRV